MWATTAMAQSQVKWIGETSSDWEDASNWQPPSVPTASYQVTILASDNDPVIDASIDVFAQNITVENECRTDDFCGYKSHY